MGTLSGPSFTRLWGKRPFAVLVVPVVLVAQFCESFNLDTEKRVVFSGPPGSYFGYSVEFFNGNSSSVSILIGAPKANTTQPGITEGGAVFLCHQYQANCSFINFDKQGDQYFFINDVNTRVEFKSNQWFGATIRSKGNNILACAPRYYWRTEHDTPFSDMTGTCYLSVDSLKSFVEYAPCRTERHGPAGQGYCQGGFSADFTKDGRVVLGGPGSFYWQGQLISAMPDEIVKAYYPSYFLLSVAGQIQTRQVQGSYDDSYLGYSVAGGEFSGDDEEDFITGVPKGLMLYGLVSIFNARDLKSMLNVTGEQMGSYFGYAVAATDINNDGLDDLIVGAPMFMFRGSNGRLEELGKVYIYLQKGPLELEPSLQHLLGQQPFGRFGTSLAPLGDLNQDGFNDMAVGCPYGGEDKQGLVLIYNGYPMGLKNTPTQTLSGHWASSSFPANFGFALRGNTDLDLNGYPDLIVGAFGVDKSVLYRSRPIVTASASLTVQPTMFNQEEKLCELSPRNGTTAVSCISISFCLLAHGKHLPAHLDFMVEIQLDSMKQNQKESVRRTLFLDSMQPSLVKTFSLANGHRLCHDTRIYLRAEGEFRDKLSPIFISLAFSLDPQAPEDQYGLRPILNYQTEQLIEQKAQIQLDCGDDNICVPDLKLAVYGDRKEVYLGDENSLSLTFNARNEGEGGAYEAELYVLLPKEADYSGIARNNATLTQLTCSYEAENETRFLKCDLGNPMKPGTSFWAGLRFTVPRLTDTHNAIQFELQLRSKNANNSESEVVLHKLELAVMANVILQGVSRPDKVFLPPPNWSVSQTLVKEQDIGPELQQVYELVNNGPSTVSQTTLLVRCPLRAHGHDLLYPVEVLTEGPLSCSSKHALNALKLKLQSQPSRSYSTLKSSMEHQIQKRETKGPMIGQGNLSCSTVECWQLECNIGLLERGASVILSVHFRLWAETFLERAYKPYVLECSVQFSVNQMPYAIPPKSKQSGSKNVVTSVLWNKPDSLFYVPVWIIILAVLAGLLLLSLLIYLLYKMGFFKRSDPYGTTMEKAQLRPQASSEA
ncbi:integrin alpha-5-like isoform X1 [Corythoichthys intestinalis]|uniref:integrin alpha-5-like isoform X1 n=1 Tax=Corythoichthys intestinalis TaxID=161448 RepID=UPI0025A5CE59|nr:integrin alpha-5-like isoform X1 [Corythoichthys intestinalis]XP_061813803.1 integrin alpha-5-like [Nerophis lumbriciformis]